MEDCRPGSRIAKDLILAQRRVTPTGQLDLFLDNRVSKDQADAAPAPDAAPSALDASTVAMLPSAEGGKTDDPVSETLPPQLLSGTPDLTSDRAPDEMPSGMPATVPALEALCRGFKDTERTRVIPEQIAALEALGDFGSRDAAAAVTRILATGIVQGPGLGTALDVAARLGSRLPNDAILVWLRHEEPDVRAAACRLARSSSAVIALLRELLNDPHDGVAEAAALALGRMARPEARPMLRRMLGDDPTEEVVEAIAGIATDQDVVALGGLPAGHPELRGAVIAALDIIGSPRALAAAGKVRQALAG